MDCEKEFFKAHPLNKHIKDTDIFLHATSIKKYSQIQSTGRILSNMGKRNFSISQAGVCFEKYVEGNYCGLDAKYYVDFTMERYCNTICETDNSKEGVVLQIIGKDLKKLGNIYADWNKSYSLVHDSEGKPIDVDYDKSVLSVVAECDIPVEYLTVARKVPIKGC